MTGFDRIMVIDWSARATPSPAREAPDAIWIAETGATGTMIHYLRTRAAAQAHLERRFDAALDAGERLVAGFDFPFAYPRGFAHAVTGSHDPLALWAALEARIRDDATNANNRFAVAADLNRLFPGVGPFWGCPPRHETPDLPARGTRRHGHGLPERRACEARLPRAQPCWKLFTTGSVGSQALLGLPRLQALRTRYGNRIAVAPFERPDTPLVLAELFPSLIDAAIRAAQGRTEIRDRAQVRVLARALAALPAGTLEAWLREGDPVEGWILGLDHADRLAEAAREAG